MPARPALPHTGVRPNGNPPPGPGRGIFLVGGAWAPPLGPAYGRSNHWTRWLFWSATYRRPPWTASPVGELNCPGALPSAP